MSLWSGRWLLLLLVGLSPLPGTLDFSTRSLILPMGLCTEQQEGPKRKTNVDPVCLICHYYAGSLEPRHRKGLASLLLCSTGQSKNKLS